MLCRLALLLLPLGAAAPAEPAAHKPSVLVMPIEPLSGIGKDLAVQVTGLLVAEAGRLPGYSVQSFRELEGVLTQEQMKQAAGCDSASCAAELAGALNTDEIVIGTLGKIGQSYLLTLSRVTAAGAQTVGRSLTKVPLRDEEQLLTQMPATVKTLFAPPATVTPPAPPSTPEDNAPPEKKAARGPSVGQQLGDAFGSLVRSGTKLVNGPRGGQVLKSENGTQPFAWMPPGRVQLGCPEKAKCARDDAPRHPGESTGLWMNKNEVTAKSFHVCIAAGICNVKVATRDRATACNLAQKRLTHPVNCVTYAEAQQYCEWEGGRLPTSDEWEYAARAGRHVQFPWGNDDVTGARANVCDKQCPQYRARRKETPIDDGFAMTAPVGNYPQGANTWGLHDMAGNVREWSFTEDRARRHELLGGSYATPAAATWARGKAPPARWDPTVGFRCVRLSPRPGADSGE